MSYCDCHIYETCERCAPTPEYYQKVKEQHDEVAERILTTVRQDQQLASVTTIRAAIMDTVDGAAFYKWMWDTDVDNANKTRVEFADAVCARITTLQRLGLK